ncbi:MAG TPA: tail fiber domain-containing protein [Ferruginibacter sp.]|nr:tail fiber domain-containing protein [Ferruginibacter sp.]HRE63785.1 tail fiber domain-containing protein [Ferruginibacter sp.]
MKKIICTTAVLLCMKIMLAQNIGIGIDTPAAKLHVTGNVVFSMPNAAPGVPTEPPPVNGAGRRLMWYPEKAAFRVGYTDASSWSFDNIGTYSFAAGYNTKARSNGAVSIGTGNDVSGLYGTALGYYNRVLGYGGSSIGAANRSESSYSFTAGGDNIAKGMWSVAIGNNNDAQAENSIAIGAYSFASGKHSVALGKTNIASGDYSFAANAYTEARSFNETVFGRYNTLTIPNSSTRWIESDRLFVIGNGTSDGSRSNALTIFKNGNVGIMTAMPDARLSVNGNASKSGGGVWAAWSDARLKKNIVPYNAGLKEILQINPVRFQYNELSGEEDLDQNYVGIIAQEIEKILPSTITIKEDDHFKDKRMFDGSELIYTLINAVKEQQQKIELLEKKITLLENK